MAKTKTAALATLTPEKAVTRLPGQTNNPLVQAALYATPEMIEDLDREIALATDYVDRLKRMRDGVTGKPDPEPEPEPVEGVPVAKVQPQPVCEDKPDKPMKRSAQDDDDPDEPYEGDENDEELPQRSALADKLVGPLIPPKGSPQREPEMLKVRKQVAELLFKRGLCSSGDIMKQLRIGPRIITEVMEHPWFEKRNTQWVITTQGKNEGLDGF